MQHIPVGAHDQLHSATQCSQSHLAGPLQLPLAAAVSQWHGPQSLLRPGGWWDPAAARHFAGAWTDKDATKLHDRHAHHFLLVRSGQGADDRPCWLGLLLICVWYPVREQLGDRGYILMLCLGLRLAAQDGPGFPCIELRASAA